MLNWQKQDIDKHKELNESTAKAKKGKAKACDTMNYTQQVTVIKNKIFPLQAGSDYTDSG